MATRTMIRSCMRVLVTCMLLSSASSVDGLPATATFYGGSDASGTKGTNYCPRGSKGGWCDQPRSHFDLAQPAFVQIAPCRAGVAHVDYERVKCQRTGGVRFRIHGRTYFMQVLVSNVGGAGDVSALSVKGSWGGGRWISMDRSWGQLWSTGIVLERQALSFAVTISDGRTLINDNVVTSSWWYGQTYEGQQFY